MTAKLRDYERTSGDRLFPTSDDAQLKDEDVREAWSHFATGYFAALGKNDARLPDAWKKKDFRDIMASVLRSDMGGIMQAYATFFRATFRRAASIRKMARDGQLDPDLVQEVARSLGLEPGSYETTLAAMQAAGQADGTSLTATPGYSIIKGVDSMQQSSGVDLSGLTITEVKGMKADGLREGDHISINPRLTEAEKGGGVAHELFHVLHEESGDGGLHP